MRRLILAGASIGFVALVVAASVLANVETSDDPEHIVVVRNEATAPVTVRLSGNDESVSIDVAARSESPIGLPPGITSLHDLVILDASCVGTGMIGFGSGVRRWADIEMVVIGPDGSVGFLLPEDMPQWNQTRQSLPAADPRLVANCVEQ